MIAAVDDVRRRGRATAWRRALRCCARWLRVEAGSQPEPADDQRRAVDDSPPARSARRTSRSGRGPTQKTPPAHSSFAKYYIALGTEIGQGDDAAQALLDLSRQCRTVSPDRVVVRTDRAAGYTYAGPSYTFRNTVCRSCQATPPRLASSTHRAHYSVVDATGNAVPAG